MVQKYPRDVQRGPQGIQEADGSPVAEVATTGGVNEAMWPSYLQLLGLGAGFKGEPPRLGWRNGTAFFPSSRHPGDLSISIARHRRGCRDGENAARYRRKPGSSRAPRGGNCRTRKHDKTDRATSVARFCADLGYAARMEREDR